MTRYPAVHGGGGHAIQHTSRPAYYWQDDARKCYRLACDLIGERIVQQRIVAALKYRAHGALPIIEIAEAIE